MKDLVSFELKKILNRMSVLIVLIGVIIVTIFYFLVFDFTYTSMYIFLPEQNIAEPIDGFSAIKYSKEINKKFNGELTDELVSKMKVTIKNEESRLNMLSEDQRFLVLNAYRNQKAIINKLENPDGTIGLVKTKFKFATKPLLLGYSTGWEKFINGFSNIGTLSLCFIIIVVFGNVFNQDYETKVDSIIYSSKFGKSKLVSAKLISSSILIFFIYTGLYIFNLILYCSIFGFDGALCNIQSSLFFIESSFNLNFLELSIIMFVIGLLSSLCLTIITLAVSSIFRNSIQISMVSFILIFFPVFFDFSGNIDRLQKIMDIMPIYGLHVSKLFVKKQLYFGHNIQALLTIIILITIMVISIYIIKFKSKKYLVIN